MRDESDPAEFPRPAQLSPGVTRWRLSDLERFEAARRGDPEPVRRSAEDERYVSDEQVCARYNVARPTPWRWAKHGCPRGRRDDVQPAAAAA